MLERSRKEIDFLEILRKREAKERATFFVFLGFCSFEKLKRSKKLKMPCSHKEIWGDYEVVGQVWRVWSGVNPSN